MKKYKDEKKIEISLKIKSREIVKDPFLRAHAKMALLIIMGKGKVLKLSKS